MTVRLAVGSASLVTAILIVVAQISAEKPGANSAAEVLNQMRQSLAGFTSMQYKFELTSKRRDREGKWETTTTDGEFAWSAGSYFSTTQVASPRGLVHDYAAFDGELYQRMTGDRTLLTVQTEIPKLPYLQMQPLLMMFGFIDIEPRRDIESTRQEEKWKGLAEKAAVKPRRAVEGHECDVIEVVTPPRVSAGDIHWEICAARDLDAYPIRVANHSGEGDRRIESVLTAKQVAERKTAHGRVIVPLEIETISRNAKGEVIDSTVLKVEKESVKVNEPIPRETFWLKRFRPIKTKFLGNVTDEQQQRFEKGPR